ncbi:hypothetical protein CS022_04955 [Veronia nyctiphanis]|uniref:Uncharacterized protein n=2 Tax=Veronia nyctiphanis TaxID=1278244 RepID=A0A4Q0YTG6_9GAMM|nr:hypothetical protein CS022_04955 [Veronia nyctiphanis]
MNTSEGTKTISITLEGKEDTAVITSDSDTSGTIDLSELTPDAAGANINQSAGTPASFNLSDYTRDVIDDASNSDDKATSVIIDNLPTGGGLFYIDDQQQKQPVVAGQAYPSDTQFQFEEHSLDMNASNLSLDGGSSVDVNGVTITAAIFTGDKPDTSSTLSNTTLQVDLDDANPGLGIGGDKELNSSAKEVLVAEFGDGNSVLQAQLTFESVHGNYKSNTADARLNILVMKDGQIIDELDIANLATSSGTATVNVQSDTGFDELRIFTTANYDSNLSLGAIDTVSATLDKDFSYHAINSAGNESESATITFGDGATTPAIGTATVEITGSIDITDVDENDTPTFNNTTIDGDYGTLTLENGDWTYTVNPQQALLISDGDSQVDNITLTATDGTQQVIAISVNSVGEAVPIQRMRVEDPTRAKLQGDSDVEEGESARYEVQFAGSDDPHPTGEITVNVSYSASQTPENLLINGDFEAWGNDSGRQVGHVASNQMQGWSSPDGGTIEHQQGVSGTASTDTANTVIELDGSGNDTIIQTIHVSDLTADEPAVLDLSFDYASRVSNSTTNQFEVRITDQNGDTLLYKHFDNSQDKSAFEHFKMPVHLTQDVKDISVAFTALGESDGYGALLDNISLSNTDIADSTDYTATETITINPDTNGKYFFDIATLEDAKIEDMEAFTVTLDRVTTDKGTSVPIDENYTSFTTVIEDNDMAQWSLSEAAATEGEYLVWEATLDSPARGETLTKIGMNNDTAEHGKDTAYVQFSFDGGKSWDVTKHGMPAGGIGFKAPEGTASVLIRTLAKDEGIYEGSETMSLTLTELSSSAGIKHGEEISGQGTITDTDEAPYVTSITHLQDAVEGSSELWASWQLYLSTESKTDTIVNLNFYDGDTGNNGTIEHTAKFAKTTQVK